MRAALAVAHIILIAADHMLASDADHRDLGPNHLDRLSATSTKNALVRRLERVGYRVTLQEVTA
ncbi:MAG TPA: hypothetical protein VMO88_11485 [Acidimicrobiales bacterium]|nr:hypothetical protein [Acidimicrobiales bacterium]